MWRVQAFADAGADILFVDALESEDEMRAFCRIAPGVPKVSKHIHSPPHSLHLITLEGGWKAPILSPAHSLTTSFPISPQMANILEGGGKTPVLSPARLEDIGFKVLQVTAGNS